LRQRGSRGGWPGDDLAVITLIASLINQAGRFLPDLVTSAPPGAVTTLASWLGAQARNCGAGAGSGEAGEIRDNSQSIGI
jgi:hypothetical protein